MRNRQKPTIVFMFAGVACLLMATIHANGQIGKPMVVAPQERRIDLTTAKSVFIGWVDISLNAWVPLGYEKQTWADTIEWANRVFQGECRRNMPNLEVAGATSRTDENTRGYDLSIRFTGVTFYVNTYGLNLAIHIIDAKPATVILSLPNRTYRRGRFSVTNCLEGALTQVAKELSKPILKPAWVSPCASSKKWPLLGTATPGWCWVTDLEQKSMASALFK